MKTTGRSDRAPPRKRKESIEDQQPQFLRKAYIMITACPSDIGGWSENGDSFIIKDSNRFAEEIIPTVYKHNKFTSFVRQLNFYGFRKVRSDLNQSALWWEFKHPLFRRGEPHLLVEIKKSVHFETSAPTALSNESFNELKDEVESMKQQIQYLEKMLREVTTSLNMNQRPVIGIPPRHVGGSSLTNSSPYSAEAMSAAGVMMGIPMDMTSPPESKKRQRVMSNTDIMPVFAQSILPDAATGLQHYRIAPSAPMIPTNGRSFETQDNGHPSMNEMGWDELETLFENEMSGDFKKEALSADEGDDMEDEDEIEAYRGPLIRGLSNNSDTLNVEFEFCGDNFDVLTNPDMLVVPASIVVNDQQIQQWEWAAVGQVLNTPTRQACQVDQLADALLSSTLDSLSGDMVEPSQSFDPEGGDAGTSAHVKPFVPTHTAGSIAEIILKLPHDLQERFTDRLSTTLGERLADHLAKQAEEVHVAMVEATYGGVYYHHPELKKENDLMDVSHYAQVVTAVTNTNHVATTVASTVVDGPVTPVANTAGTIGVAAGPFPHAIPTNVYQSHVPTASTLAQVIGSTAATVGMSFPFAEYHHSVVTQPNPTQNEYIVSSDTTEGHATTATTDTILNSNDVTPTSASSAQPTPLTSETHTFCGSCAHCRSNALQQSYHPQQPAIAYPLAAAALGALFVKWGDACARHQY